MTTIEPGGIGRAHRLGAFCRRHWAVILVVTLGLLLRLAMLVALPQPLLAFTDANAYVHAAAENLFRPEEGRTAGYPLFLRALHGLWPTVLLPIVLQHVLALAASVLLYVIARSRGVAGWAAALPAGVWALSIDWLWLEQQFLTETLSAVLIVTALACAVVPRVVGRRSIIALGVAVAGLALGAAIVRPALFAAVPGIGLALLIARPAPWRQRVMSVTAFTAAFMLAFGGYILVQQQKTGFRGLVGSGLVNLGGYPAAAPFARCDRFTVPVGTRSLCQRVPPDKRPGSDYYYWDPTSPGRRLLQSHPEMAQAIEEWGKRAMATSAGALWNERARSFERLLGLGSYERPLTDQGPELFQLEVAVRGRSAVVVDAVGAYYGGDAVSDQKAGVPWKGLARLQPVTRPPGLLILLALVVTMAAALVARRRAGLVLAVAATGWGPVLFATWRTSQYNWRYIVPGLPLITLATVLAGTVLATAWRQRDSAVAAQS